MTTLINRQFPSENSRPARLYKQFGELLIAIREKMLPDDTILLIDQEVVQLNSIDDDQPHLIKALKIGQQRILRLLADKHKIFPMQHFRNQWMILGMSSFGIPLGVAVGLMIKNLSLLGAGIPIGMVIGMSVGKKLDQKTLYEGRQLNIELKY